MKIFSFFILVLSISIITDISYADINVCTKFNYPQNMEIFGKSIEELGIQQFVFQKEENNIIYYKVICPDGQIHETPTGKEKPKDIEVIWGFIKKNEKQIAFKRLLQFTAHRIGMTIFSMSKNFYPNPILKLEKQINDSKNNTGKKLTEVYIWHTNEGLISELKAYPINGDMFRIYVDQYLKTLKTQKE